MGLVKDQVVEGVISGITNFGAFVKIGDVTGLVHISEVSVDFIKNINDIYKLGDVVKVKVIRIEDGGKVVLSIKKAILDERNSGSERYERHERADRFERNDRQTGYMPKKKPEPVKSDNFEDKLARFLKDSEEIQLDARHSQDLARKKKKKN